MKRLLHQFSWVTSGQIIAAIVQLLLIVVLARSVSPAVFGLVSAVFGLGIALQAISDLGISRLVVREHSVRDRDPGLVPSALRLNNIATRMLILLGLCALGLASLGGGELYLLMLPLAIAMGLEKNADTWIGVSLAEGKAHLASINLVMRRTVSLVLFMILSWSGIDAVLAYSLALAGGAAVSVVFSKGIVRRMLLAEESVPVRRVLKSAFPYYTNSVAVQLRNLDVFIVTFSLSASAAGLYSSAKRLVNPLLLIPTALSTVLLPAVARSGGGGRMHATGRIALVGLLSIIPYSAIAWAIPWLLPWALGDAYASAVNTAQMIVLFLPFAVSGSLLTSYLQGIGAGRVTAYVAVISTVYCLSGILLGGLVWGLPGAAFFMATTSVVQVVLQVTWLLSSPRQN